MTRLVLSSVMLGTFVTILTAASPFAAAFAMGGGGGGMGGGGAPASLMRLDPPEQPSPQSRPAHVRSTHKTKKIIRHSSVRQPGT